MRPSFIIASLLAGLVLPAVADRGPRKGVPTRLYNRLVHFLAISQATYAGDGCHITNLPRLQIIRNNDTDLYGWVLRDDATREIVVVFRGSVSATNSNTNRNFTLGAIESLPSCVGCMSHGGYYLAWLSIMEQVLSHVKTAKRRYPLYKIVVTGHRFVLERPSRGNERI